MKVLIVAKTHMSDKACVGAIVYDTGQSIRLLQPDCSNQPESTRFDVGQVWDLELRQRPDPIPPHIEDVLVIRKQYLGIQHQLAAFLRSRVIPWNGAPSQLYQGLLRFTQNGSGYISRRIGIPDNSTGYWIPDHSLSRLTERGKTRYQYKSKSSLVCITYVGFQPPIDAIPAGTLVRVSLARWWTPEDADIEERCYLQLSGWYSQ